MIAIKEPDEKDNHWKDLYFLKKVVEIRIKEGLKEHKANLDKGAFCFDKLGVIELLGFIQ